MNERDAARMEEELRGVLQAAVPMWVERFRTEGRTKDQLIAIAHEAGQVLAEKGDILQFGTKKKGETARVFNALAAGIAAAACVVPGGFDVFGAHWEASI